MMRKLALAIILMLNTVPLLAQEGGVEMADGMRSDGKIYVVVACFVLILLGLLIYLFTLDRRLKKLEKKS